MRYLILFSLTVVISFAFLLACDNPVLPDIVEGDTSSPVNVALAVESAINGNDMNRLLNLYSSDMRFYFDPNEVGTEVDGHIIPESWDAETDVSKIGLSITNGITLEVNIDENSVGVPGKGNHTSPEISFTADYQYSA